MNIAVKATNASNRTGYKSFELGSFKFRRDEYFVYIEWKSKRGPMTHYMSADAFLRALMRDVAWGFFYYQVNFDHVFGTNNLYGQVEMFAGSFNETFRSQGLNLTETFDTPEIMETFKAILVDWTNEGFDPFAAPAETGSDWLGPKHGDNLAAALGQNAVFPPMLVRMISAGEQTGKVDVMLEKISDFYDEEIEATLAGLTSLIEPLLIVFLGVVVGSIVICMFLPIFKLNQIVQF